MRILVTGGLGFIGVNLVGHLLKRGYRISIYDNGSVGSLGNLERMFEDEAIDTGLRQNLLVIDEDILNQDALSHACIDCSAIIHLAAHTNVAESLERPSHSFHINAIGTLNVLEAARAQGTTRVVLASSNAAAGQTTPPVHEEVVQRPISPYGASKLTAEALASAYAVSFGMHTICLRFANAYGPYSLHKNSVVALFIKRILRDQHLTLFDNGSPTRDYVYVYDIVQAIEAALTLGDPGEVYQIGTGIETSILQLTAIFRSVTRKNIKTVNAPARQGEITRNFSDINKASTQLQFAPTVYLADGIAKLWPWFEKYSR